MFRPFSQEKPIFGQEERKEKQCGYQCPAMLVWQAYLPQYDKARLVRGQAKHDEICVEAVQAVARVGVPAGASALLPNVRHYFVLALPRNIRIRQNDLRVKHMIASHRMPWAIGAIHKMTNTLHNKLLKPKRFCCMRIPEPCFFLDAFSLLLMIPCRRMIL